MSEAYVGEIKAVGFNFTPVDWMPCDGRLLKTNEYNALFSLIGKTYGGDGSTTFALPDLRGRIPINTGGYQNYSLGQKVGQESVSLNADQIPQHTHPLGSHVNAKLKCSSGPASTTTPVANTIAANAVGVTTLRFNTANPDASMKNGAVKFTGNTEPSSGGSNSHDNTQPYQALLYIICVNGLYPTLT